MKAAVEMGRAIFVACLLGYTGAIKEALNTGKGDRDQLLALNARGGEIMTALLAGEEVSGVSLANLGRTKQKVNEAVTLTTMLYMLHKVAPDEVKQAMARQQDKKATSVEG